MSDIVPLTDRDLLIKIDTKLSESVIPAISTLTEGLGKLTDRVSALELEGAKNKGFIVGAKALWGLLAGLPAGALAILFAEKAT